MNIEQAIELTDEPASFQKRRWTEVETPNATGMQLILRKLVKVVNSPSYLHMAHTQLPSDSKGRRYLHMAHTQLPSDSKGRQQVF